MAVAMPRMVTVIVSAQTGRLQGRKRAAQPRHHVALSAIRGAALAVYVALVPLGCFTALDDDPAQPACFDQGGCNGVAVYCLNHGVPGADETGGEGGGSPVQNYWLLPADVLCDDLPVCGGPIPDDQPGCCTLGCGACYLKEFSDLNPGAEYYPSLDRVCVGQNWPGAVDPIVDWQSLGESGGTGGLLPPGDYPDIESEIRNACSARCSMKPNASGSPAQCEDDNWSDVLLRLLSCSAELRQ
jgi:hypothetical protein